MKKRSLILSLLLLLVTFSVFQHVPRLDFVDWDDDKNVINNPYLNPVTLANVGKFWTAPYNSLYTPLTNTVWAAAAVVAWDKEPHLRQSGSITHLAPDIFHGLGLLIHLANVLLVFMLLRRIIQKDIPAAAGALLFGIHPLQVEVVAWVTGMNNTLAAFFCLLSLLFYIRWAQENSGRAVNLNSILATVLYCLALLSKPTATALPVVALVMEIGLFRRTAREFVPILLLWSLFAGAMVLATRQATDIGDLVYLPITGRPFVAGDAVAFYLGRLLWPSRFCPDYGRLPLIVLSHWWGYATSLVPLALILAIWRFRLRWLGLAFGVFIAAALPVLGFVPYYLHTMSTVGDRFVYLSLLGPAIALAWLMTIPAVVARPRITFAILTLVFAALALVSYRQTERWETTQSLLTHTLAVNPNSVRALNNLGAISINNKGKTDEGIAFLNKAISIDPDMAPAQYSLGNVLLNQGHVTKAFSHLWRASKVDPFNAINQQNLGVAYLRLGHPREGQKALERSLQLEETPVAHYHLGLAYEDLGRKEQAIAEYKRALQMAPNFSMAKKKLNAVVSGSSGTKSH